MWIFLFSKLFLEILFGMNFSVFFHFYLAFWDGTDKFIHIIHISSKSALAVAFRHFAYIIFYFPML